MAKTTRGGAQAPRSSAKTTTRPADVARIQSAVSTQHGGGVRKVSYRINPHCTKRPFGERARWTAWRGICRIDAVRANI